MKVAIPVFDKSIEGNVYSVFGRSPYFAILSTEDDSIVFVKNTAENAVGGAGTKSSQILLDQHVDAIISYQIGENALSLLQLADIAIYQAQKGTIKEHINLLKNNQLVSLTNIHPGRHGSH
ncbi:MAG: NifB/NifX family molybdenum-iron cluster-binding protein [Bacilli bacterium]